MADTQFTILGMSGAGKTCYLLGLYYKMSAGMKGYTITTDEDTDVQLRDRYAKMCDRTLGKERFPAGTDNISQYTFDLQYGYKTIMSFEWLDYPGGALDRKNDGNLDEYENLKNAINHSSSLFICVDGSLLLGDDRDEKIDKVRDNCSSVINSFFSEYLKGNHILPPTAILVTKYDMCKDDTDEDELCEVIEEAFSPFFVKDESQKIVAIIPISIGKNIMDDDYSGQLSPMNIHLPIFMGIWFALGKKVQKQAQLLADQKEKIKQNVSQLRDQKAREENKWWIFKNKDEIHRWAEEIRKAETNGTEQTQAMQALINAILNNSERLIKELDRISHVYINGDPGSFRSLIGGSVQG